MAMQGTDWSCLSAENQTDAMRPPPEIAGQQKTANFSVQITNLVTRAIPASLQARACARIDVDCATPILQGLTIAPDGQLHARLFEGFDGYFEITSPDMVPELLFINEPLRGTDTQAYPAFMVPVAAALSLAQTMNVALRDDAGLLAVWVFDCQHMPAPRVELSTDSDGLVFNYVDGLPTVQTTTVDGVGGVLNVPAGSVVLTGTLQNGRNIGVESFLMRPRWLTAGYIQPAPSP